MKQQIVFFLLIMILFTSCNQLAQSEEKPLSLVPFPNHIERLKTGYIMLGTVKTSLSNIPFSIDPVISLLHTGLKQTLDIQLQPLKQGEKVYNLQFVYKEGGPNESYHLTVNEKGVTLSASDYNGFLYGAQTLLQLAYEAKQVPGGYLFPGVKIDDKPNFSWRGMHLDVCRHFFDVAFIKKMLFAMSAHKMNVFHWHLTDDQGWRIEIKQYPQLSKVAAWRNHTIIGHMASFPAKYDNKRYGGYYTQKEIREVVNYAAKLGITIVPEIEMPGHAVAALTAYPEISCTGVPIKPMCEWGVSDDVYCAGKESTFRFLENVLDEVTELFPGKYIHIGGDECPKTRWHSCPDCQNRIKAENLKDENELQSYFVKRIEKYLTSKGKKMIGWDEILEGGLAENAAVMSWRGEQGGIEAANQGHQVVMTPNELCYLDHYQSNNNEPLTIGGLTTMEDIYKWNIIPEKLTDDKKELILGAQANVWTEYMPDEDHVEYMVFPRMCAMSEILWTKKPNRSFNSFINRMGIHYNQLDDMDIDYRIPYPGGIERYNPILNEKQGIVLKCEIPTATIHYTIDGTNPDEKSPLYNVPLQLNLKKPVEIRAVTVMPSGRKSAIVKGIFEKCSYKKAYSKELTEKGVKFYRFDHPINSAYQISGKPDTTGVLPSLSIPAGKRGQFFGVTYSGFIEVPADGIYTYYLDCDDGGLLFIDSCLVVDNDGCKYGGTKDGKIALAKGKHPFEIKYFQAKYGYSLTLSYSLNGVERKQVDPNQYFWQ